MKINQLIEQEVKNRKLKWNNRPDIGWLIESDTIRLYYGTDIRNTKKIFKEGIYANTDGYVLCAAEPNTAQLHSVIRILSESKQTDHSISNNQKAIFIVDVPKKYTNQINSEARLYDKELYESWGKSDIEYYALVDVKIKNHIPVDWIKGYMIQNDC